MRLTHVLREAAGNTTLMLFLFLASFPFLAPAFLWLLRNFFGVFHAIDPFFRALKG